MKFSKLYADQMTIHATKYLKNINQDQGYLSVKGNTDESIMSAGLL
jgi:hypothetical protein